MERTLLYDWKAPLTPQAGYEHELSFPDRAVRALEAANDYLRVNFTTDKDKRHHFSMVLRRGWFLIPPQNLPGDPTGIHSIARLLLKDLGGPVHLSVQAVPLRRELAAADWLTLLLNGQRAFTTHRRAFQTPTGTQLEVLALISSLGKPWVARMTALKDGDRLFFLRAWISLPRYEAFAEDFFTAFQSFRLLDPAGEPCAEPLVERRLGIGSREHALELRFKVPAAWKTEGEARKAAGAKAGANAESGGTDLARSGAGGLETGIDPSHDAPPALSSQSLLSAFSAASSVARGLSGAAAATNPLSAAARGLSGAAAAASLAATGARATGGTGTTASTVSSLARGLGGAVSAAVAVGAAARGGGLTGLVSAATAVARGGQALSNAGTMLSRLRRANKATTAIPDPADVDALLASPPDPVPATPADPAPLEFDDTPKTLVLKDNARSGELRAGLLRREPGLKRDAVLQQLLGEWTKAGLEIDRAPTLEGPYPFDDPEVTTRFWEFRVRLKLPPRRSDSSSPEELPQLVPTTLRLVILRYPGAWVWVGYLGPRPDAPLEAPMLGRRAFELVLKNLQAAHPGMFPADEDRKA